MMRPKGGRFLSRPIVVLLALEPLEARSRKRRSNARRGEKSLAAGKTVPRATGVCCPSAMNANYFKVTRPSCSPPFFPGQFCALVCLFICFSQTLSPTRATGAARQRLMATIQAPAEPVCLALPLARTPRQPARKGALAARRKARERMGERGSAIIHPRPWTVAVWSARLQVASVSWPSDGAAQVGR